MGDLVAIGREDVGRVRWDDFVDAADEAWLWHTWDLHEALLTWPGEDRSFAIVDTDDEVVGLVPLRWLSERVGRLVHTGGLDSLGGPALANDLGRRRQKAVTAVRDHLLEIAKAENAREVRMSLSPLAPAYRGDHAPRVNPLLPMGGENVVSQTWMLRLGDDEESIWSGMQGRARTAVRKAEREQVTVRLAGRDDLDAYYQLHLATYDRTGAPPHPRSYFEAIWSRFLATDRAFALIAELRDEVIAAQSFAVFKGAVGYWTGAGADEALRLGTNNLLQWEGICEALRRELEWYEAGEAFPSSRNQKLRGLSDFKRSTGGELLPLYRMRIDTASRLVNTVTLARELLRTLTEGRR